MAKDTNVAGSFPKISAPDQPLLESVLNRMIAFMNTKLGATRVVGSKDISVDKEGEHGYKIGLIRDSDSLESIRFRLVWDAVSSEITVGKGNVAFLPCCSGTDSGGAGGGSSYSEPYIIVPIEPTVEGSLLWSVPYSSEGQPPTIKLDKGEGVYKILLKGSHQAASLHAYFEDDEIDPLGLGEQYFQLGTVTLTKGTGDDSERFDASIHQTWESDVTLNEVPPSDELSSSSSSSGSNQTPSEPSNPNSSSASSSQSSSSQANSSSPSSGLPPDSDVSSSDPKTTAIVPASWTKDNYTALFIAEMPEVRFDDVLVIHVRKNSKRHFRAPIDHKFVEVCEKDRIQVCGYACGKAAAIGLEVSGGWVHVELPFFKWNRPKTITVRLSGIRKGFYGTRFPNRNKEQFDANEAFINTAYPANKDPQ